MTVEGRTCPHCGGDCSASRGFDGSDAERPGTVMACLGCAQLCMLEVDGSLRQLSFIESIVYGWNPQVIAVKRVAENVRRGLLHPERN